MKPAVLIPVSLVLCACTGTGHYDAEEFELVGLKSAVQQLFDVPTSGDHIEKRWWPAAIDHLEPQAVRKGANGIYIKLDSFFVEESGLFIPLPGTVFEADEHADPSYRLLGEGIYSYYVTG